MLLDNYEYTVYH